MNQEINFCQFAKGNGVLFLTTPVRSNCFWIASLSPEKVNNACKPDEPFLYMLSSFVSILRSLNLSFNSRATLKQAKSGQAFCLFKVNAYFNCWLGKNDTKSAGWECPSLPSWELEFFSTSSWECGTAFLFPAT